MGSFKKVIVLAAVSMGMMTLAIGDADAKPVRVGVTAIGTANDSDKGSATDAAKESAKGNLVCAGRLEDVTANATGCVKAGGDDNPNYVCTAVARGTCVIGG